MVRAGRYPIGPDNGNLILRTFRQGLAATVGHDLTIEVTDWSGQVTVTDDPAATSVAATFRTGSLRVIEGTGGVKPLSDRDRREILGNARKILGSDRIPTATFTSTSISDTTMAGTVTLCGQSRPIRLRITELGGDRYQATGEVVQSDFGIKPYTAFFGALKLADAVDVHAEVELTGASG